MRKKDKVFYSVAGTTGTAQIISRTSTTAIASDTVKVWTSVYEGDRALGDKIQKAVYAHIQAVRTLGRERISTQEIAEALAIPQAYVIAAVEKLRDKGIRVAG